MSEKTTEGILVQVSPHFLSEHSDVERGLWVFAYRVEIENVGTQPAQLISRHWIITDGWGKVEEVKGPGVVGKQPYLRPGEGFAYTSFCPLPTPTGSMRGFYQMLRDDQETFEAEIASFALIEPGLH